MRSSIWLAGLAATAAHWAIDPNSTAPVIGASGAIAAVLGAFAVTYPHARIRTLVFLFIFVTVLELPAYLFLALWFGGQLLSGLGTLGGQMDGGVAWWAHVGGFVFGAALMPLLSTIAPPEPDALPRSSKGFTHNRGRRIMTIGIGFRRSSFLNFAHRLTAADDTAGAS